MGPEFIDRIYESAFVPERWPEVLDELSDLAGARTGFLFISRGEIHNWTSSTRTGVEALGPLVESGWVANSERFSRFTNRRHAGFLTDDVIFRPEERKSDPFYQDVLYPRAKETALLACATNSGMR